MKHSNELVSKPNVKDKAGNKAKSATSLVELVFCFVSAILQFFTTLLLGHSCSSTPFRDVFNVNMFLKSVSTSKSRVTYDLDTDRVTYDLDTDRVTYDLDTTMHKIIGVVGSPLYLAMPVSTALPKSHPSL